MKKPNCAANDGRHPKLSLCFGQTLGISVYELCSTDIKTSSRMSWIWNCDIKSKLSVALLAHVRNFLPVSRGCRLGFLVLASPLLQFQKGEKKNPWPKISLIKTLDFNQLHCCRVLISSRGLPEVDLPKGRLPGNGAYQPRDQGPRCREGRKPPWSLESSLLGAQYWGRGSRRFYKLWAGRCALCSHADNVQLNCAGSRAIPSFSTCQHRCW